jgi:hypothetical protein
VRELGQSTTVATAFAVVIIVVGIIAVITFSLSSLQIISGTLSSQVSRAEDSLGERVSIDGWSQVDMNTIRINVTNVGEVSVQASDFPNIDVFVIYKSYNSSKSVWLGYNQTASSGDYWKVDRAFLNGGGGELVNPLHLTGQVYGAWDSGETLELEAHVDVEAHFEYVVIVSPKGGRASLGQGVSLHSGRATIPANDVFVVITHGIFGVPTNIQLTPFSEPKSSYWVSEVNNSTFTVSLQAKQSTDFSFYWLATP